MSKENVLVVGGAGFIGSLMVKMLADQGYKPLTLDNLCIGNRKSVIVGEFIQGDMGDCDLLEKIFQNHQIDVVMHFGALSDVGESVVNPAKYFQNNVSCTINLLNTMIKYNVKKVVFSSSASIYGIPKMNKITECHCQNPINPYGHTKVIIEKLLSLYEKAYGLLYCNLRYFNAAGGDPEGKVKNYKSREHNLIPLILKSLLESDGVIKVNGEDYDTKDGTCVRDYIHIHDICNAHILAMMKLLTDKQSNSYNLGLGEGFTVYEVIRAAEKATGKRVKMIVGPRRPGDPTQLVAESKKAEAELGWKPQYTELELMIKHAWDALN